MYIQLTNVSKKIKSNDILKDINLRMVSRERTAVVKLCL